MNAIQQTVQIPADRRLQLNVVLPDHIPVGKAEMLLVLSPVPEQAHAQRLGGMRGLGTVDKDLDIKAFGREEIIAMFEGRA
jgi:hypothetical protein